MNEINKKALTIRAFILGLILVLLTAIIGNFTFYFGNWYAWLLWDPKAHMYLPVFYSFIPVAFLIFVPAFITTLLPKRIRFSRAELAVICSMTSLIPNLTVNAGSIQMVLFIIAASVPNSAVRGWVLDTVSPFLAPLDVRVLQGMFAGKSAVPWDSWTLPLIYWMFHLISMYIFFLFIASLLRRQYVEIEELSFPLASVIQEVIDLSTTDGLPRMFRSKFFWIGVLISFAVGMGKAFQNIGIPGLPYITLVLDLVPLALISAPLAFGLEPWIIGFGYLLNTDILITSIIAFFVLFWIVPLTLVSAGIATPLGPGSVIGWYFVGLNQHLQANDVTRWGYSGLTWGLMIGLVFYPLYIHRKAFMSSLKALFKRSSEMHEGEVMSYRYLWAGTFLSGILYLASLLLVNIPIEWAILGIIINVFHYTGLSRIRAESGAAFGGYFQMNPNYPGFWQWAVTQGRLAADPSKALHTLLFFSGLHGSQVHLTIQNAVPMPIALENFRVGYLSGVRSRDIFIAQVVTGVLGVAITLPLSLWWYYTYGGTSQFIALGLLGRAGYWYTGWAYQTINQGFIHHDAPTWFVLGTLIFGVVLTVAMMWARVRYIRFIFNPVGIIMAMLLGPIMWIPFIIALVARWLSFRVGAELYANKGRPMATGLIIGIGLAYALSAFILVLRTLGVI